MLSVSLNKTFPYFPSFSFIEPKTFNMHSLMTYAGASWRIRIANVFLIAGKLLHVIGMFTPFWLTTGNNHQGLWQMCLDMIIATKCFSMMSIDLEGNIKHTSLRLLWYTLVKLSVFLFQFSALFYKVCVQKH